MAPDAIVDRFTDAKPDGAWYESIQQNIKAGETIYDIYSYIPETWERDESEVKIGSLKLTTDLYTSLWGDEMLHF